MHEHEALGEGTIRVLVVDGSPIHTHLLVDALSQDPRLRVFPFDSDSKLLTDTARSLGIDVLLINSTLNEQPGRGFEALREQRAASPGIRAVVLMDSSTDEAVLTAFRAGARGVFSKQEPAAVLGKCIRCVHEGQIWANSRELTIAIEALASAPVVRALDANGMNLLSKRELQVVRSLAEGLSNREIAERLKLSQHTVKNYLFRVFDKLGVSSRVELLFMTLSGAVAHDSTTQPLRSSQAEFTAFQEAAEAGLPGAQLALSQMYWARRRDAQDPIEAYMWYLIATECGSQAGELMSGSLTAVQIAEAQKRADAWRIREVSSHPANDSICDSTAMLPTADAAHPSPAKRSAKAKTKQACQ